MLNCIACKTPQKVHSANAVGVLCSKCRATEEGWEKYDEWKRKTGWGAKPKQRKLKVKDKADVMIDALEAEIRKLQR